MPVTTATHDPGQNSVERNVTIGPLGLAGDLRVPTNASAMVIFAHGSGSSRFSPRNRMVAESLNLRGMATLLFDLLTSAEEQIEPMCSTSLCWPGA